MGDTNMCTDNPIIVNNTLNSKTIICVQRKAEKKVPTEADIIKSNKLAFNDDIGIVTNHVTSMFEVQAGLDKDSPEYKTLSYRIMCGQLYQQNTIDRAKGIIAKPMPNYWYDNPRFIMSGEDDGEAEMERAAFNARISAYRKPYFMIYVYPKLKKDYLDYVGKSESKSEILFGLTMDELQESEDEDATAFLNSYFTYLPVGKNKCVVNRICEIFENEFDSWSAKRPDGSAFDYSILKSGVEYSHKDYVSISEIYNDYLIQINNFHNRTRTERMDKFEAFIEKQTFVDTFRYRCSLVCPNRYELCDIMLDICYDRENGKRFVWDVCGDVIIDNLLAKNNHEIHFPVVVDEDGDFKYGGQNFEMHSMILCEDTEDE